MNIPESKGIRFTCPQPLTIHDEIIGDIDQMAGRTLRERIEEVGERFADYFNGDASHVVGHEHIWRFETPGSALFSESQFTFKPAVDPENVQRIDIEALISCNGTSEPMISPVDTQRLAMLLEESCREMSLGESQIAMGDGFLTVALYDVRSGELAIDVHFSLMPSPELPRRFDDSDPEFVQCITLYDNRDNLPSGKLVQHVGELLSVTGMVYNLAHQIANHRPPGVEFELNKDTELE